MCYYLTSEYSTAIKCFLGALERITDPEEKIWLLAPLAVSLASLGEERKLEHVEAMARRFIEDGSFVHMEIVSRGLEGIGRAQGLLRQSKALKTLDEAMSIYSRIKQQESKMPFREVELARSKLEVVHYLQPNDSSIESIGVQGIHLAQEYGYPRHAQHMMRLLSASL